MKYPNFFILGAPKCGTTSMVDWLSEHPEIYFSPSKEPHYYNTDHSHNVITTKKQYLKLFDDATQNHKVLGEASVWYLYSQDAVKNIINDKVGDVKYLVMLRNPVAMSYSLHEQQVFNLNENILDFEEAWFLQDRRKENKDIAITTRDSKLLLYGDACKLGEQVDRLLKRVKKEDVKFILLDDVKEDPKKVYDDILNFLEINPFNKLNFEVLNSAKVRKNKNTALLVKILGKIKHKLRITKGFGILNKSNELNVSFTKRAALSPKMEQTLKEYFKSDILLLQELIQRDLSNWLK